MKTHSLKIGRRIIGAAAACVLILIASCSTPKENTSADTEGAPVSVVHPAVTSLVESMEFNATTTFLKKEIVRSTFQGFIQKTMKTIGDPIAAGEILFYLKTKEGAAVDSTIATNNAALFRGSVPVAARSTGVLTEMNFHTGDYVGEGEQLAVISNPTSLAVMLNVPYQDAARITPGTQCRVLLPDGRRVAGVVATALPSVDPVSQTQTFIIRCADMTHLPTNLNLIVTIPLHTVRNAVVLPTRSIQSNETLDRFWIMKLVNDSTAVKVPIVRGSANDSLVQIVTPALTANDRILLEGGYGLPDTARVRMEN